MEVMGSSVDDVPLTCVSIKRQDERKTLSYLPNRPPVDIEFTDLSYTVPQGRKGKPHSSDFDCLSHTQYTRATTEIGNCVVALVNYGVRKVLLRDVMFQSET